MDVVKNQLARIQQQLSGLTPSQKMLTAALVTIMVMTLLYWGRQAGTAEMAPVLDQAIAKDAIPPMVARLRSMGIEARVEHDRVLVPAGRVWEALADLAYADLLPQNSETGFDQMVAKLSPWAGPSERAALENRGKEITCAQIIRLFPGVRQAQVMIDPTSTRHIGRANIEPSATVNITLRDDDGGARKVAEAAASVVSGAQASLSPARINVVVNGQPQRLRAAAGGAADALAAGDDLLDQQLKHQQIFENNILAVLPNVPDLRVAVSVRLNRDEKTTDEQVIDAEKTVSKARRDENEDTETRDGRPPAQEPGAMTNVGNGTANQGLEIPSAGGGGTGTTSSKTKTENEILPSFIKTHIKHGSGGATVVSASVRVPRSYFLQVWKQRYPDKPADDAAVEALAQDRIKDMEKSVRASVGLDEKAAVFVGHFDDVMPLAPPTPPQTATASIPLMIGRHSKEIALGGLALVSLFMVSMLVRRSAPAPLLAEAASGNSGVVGAAGGVRPQFPAGEARAAEAGAGKGPLDAMELDDDDGDDDRTQQMFDRVSALVADNPDAAASLVKCWLNRD